MNDITVYGRIENGAFYPKNSKVYIQRLKDAGTVENCILTISGSNKRTLDQNSYAWGGVFNTIEFAMQQAGYTEVTAGMLYRQAEEKYCEQSVINEKTGKSIPMIKPLKEQSPDRFWEIMEEIRTSFNANPVFDAYIETPAEFYGLTEQAYDLLKQGVINMAEARKMSNE